MMKIARLSLVGAREVTGSRLLLDRLASKKLDPFAASFLAVALAHELGWPVHFVPVAQHAFVRWDDGKGTTINMDQGRVATDFGLRKKFKVSACAIKSCAYLNNLDRAAFLSRARTAVALEHLRRGRAAEALVTAQAALKMDPTNVLAAHACGVASEKDGETTRALSYYGKAIALDPYFHPALARRARIDFEFGALKSALKDVTAAISIEGNDEYYFLRGMIYKKFVFSAPRSPLSGRYIQQAIQDFSGIISRNNLLIRDLERRAQQLVMSSQQGSTGLRVDPSILSQSRDVRELRSKAKAIMMKTIPSYMEMGKLAMRGGQVGFAYRAFNTVITYGVKAPELFVLRGRMALQLKKYDQAIQDYTKSVQLGRKDAQIYYERGLALAATSRYRKAIADFDKSDSLGNDVYFARGKARLALKSHTKALADFTEVIRDGDRPYAAYIERGMAYVGVKNYRAAMKDFTKGLSLAPSRSAAFRAFIGRGIVLSAEGKYDLAMKDFKQAIAYAPAAADAYHHRGAALALLGKHRKAVRDFDKALALKHDAVDSRYLRGVSYFKLKDYRSTLADMNAVIAARGGYAEAYYYRALTREKLFQTDKAFADYNRAIALDGKNATFYHARGRLFVSYGKYRDAIRDFSTAIALDPARAAAYRLARGKALAATGLYQPARKDLDTAQKLDPKLNAVQHKRRIGATPELITDAQLRYGSTNKAMDGRTSINATWYLANLHKNLNLGMRVGFGYAGSKHHDAVDLDGSLALINQFAVGNLIAEIGAGYAFHVTGDVAKSAAGEGAFFKYGLRYNLRLSELFNVGASLAVQHQMKDPKRVAVAPGIDVTFNLW